MKAFPLVAQVVPAAFAGRPEAFLRARSPELVILSGASRGMPFTEIAPLRFLLGTRSEESLLIAMRGGICFFDRGAKSLVAQVVPAAFAGRPEAFFLGCR